MSYSEYPLTEWQREQAARRILSDAELIQRGATISAAGTLVLGDHQLVLTALLEEFPYFLPAEDQPFGPGIRPPGPQDEWMNTPVGEALLPRYASSKDIPQPIRGMTLPIRDLLVVGKNDVSSWSGYGSTSINALSSLIGDNEFGITWQDKPTPEYIAHNICRHLGEVTAMVLHLDLPGEAASSVLDIVKMPPERRQELCLGQYRYSSRSWLYPSEIDELSNAPEVFAIRFERERWRIAPEPDDRGL